MFLNNIFSNGANSQMTLEEIIQEEIKEWHSSTARQLMLDGQRYYEGDTDILKSKRMAIGEGGELEEVKNLANNKLVHQFARKLADQKVGYLLSKPLAIQTDNEQYKDILDSMMLKQLFLLLGN